MRTMRCNRAVELPEVIHAAFDVGPQLGGGGQGCVFVALHRATHEHVALKVVALDEAADSRVFARLQREWELLASLEHPGIVRGVVPPALDRASGLAWFAMELLHGETLGERLTDHDRLSAAETRQIAEQLLSALDAAHARGVVHRDVKPSNVFLADDRGAVLLDFGIAAMTAAPAQHATETGEVAGTTCYLPPERVRGDRATPQSDLYALGLVLIECLDGARPWSDEPAMAQTLLHGMLDEPVPLSDHVRASTLGAAIEGAVAKRTEDRWLDAPAMRRTLGARARSLPRRRSVAVVAAALFVASLGAVGFAAIQPDTRTAQVSTPVTSHASTTATAPRSGDPPATEPAAVEGGPTLENIHALDAALVASRLAIHIAVADGWRASSDAERTLVLAEQSQRQEARSRPTGGVDSDGAAPMRPDNEPARDVHLGATIGTRLSPR